ncbi:MAG: gluconokinase [Solirubrobacteraceae bacterium]
MTVVVGLDIGTTAVKALQVREDGSAGGRDERVYGPGADAATIVSAALELAGDGPVALSSAMHSLIGLDAENEPVTPLLTWADTRSVEQAERIKAEHPHLHARTGTPIHPMSPLCKLAWFRDQGIEAERWVGIKELVVHRLTGEWVMDHSVASGTGLMALETLDWDPEALDVAGVTADQLPRLVPTTERLGFRAKRGWIVVGAGDGPLANLGLGAVQPGVAACSIGTSGALRLVVESAAVTDSTFCFALTPGRWVVGGAINNGGIVLEWLSKTLNRPIETLLDLAADARSDGLQFDPYLLSERAPHWDARLQGSISGLRHDHGPGELVRAALEGVCRQLGLVLGSLRGAGHEVREIRATGGFARSPLFKQLLADALAMPVGFTATREGSAYGAALLGLAALDLVDLDRAAALIGVTETVEPSPVRTQARPSGRAFIPNTPE